MTDVERAVALFRGKERYNCAQAILSAFGERYAVSPDAVAAHKKKGNGRARDGICGAPFAAETLFEVPHLIDELYKRFAEAAGTIQCKPIRKAREISCQECVAITARIITDMEREGLLPAIP